MADLIPKEIPTIEEIKVVFEKITLPDTFIELEKATIDLSKEEASQETYRVTENKYCQVKEVADGNMKKSITEYLCPNGEVGYQIILKKTIEDKEYCMSKGYGQEASSRTFNWQEIINE